jgi:hypothetical protein
MCMRKAHRMKDAVQAAYRIGGMEAVTGLIGAERVVTVLPSEWPKADEAVDFALLSAPFHVVGPFARTSIEKAQSELRTAWKTRRSLSNWRE